jgi:predicted O-methyltransferase YrrM
LFPKDTPHRYPAIGKGEDSELASKFTMRRLDNDPCDYIRTFHGSNTWGQEHFDRFLRGGRELTPGERRYLDAVLWWSEHQPRQCNSIADVKAVLGSLKWMGWSTAKFATNLIREHGLKRILEIGTLHGVSTCYFASTGAEVTTVDLPQSAYIMPRVEDTLAACGLKATIVREPSREAMARWIVEGRQFDLIYVDGSHTLGDAMCDLLMADKLLRPGGWLIVDDVANKDYPGVAEAWAMLPESYGRHGGPQTWGVATKAQ